MEENDETATLPLYQVNTMEADLQAQLDHTEGAEVEALQQVLDCWLTQLHPSHFLILLVKRKLLAALKLREQFLSDLEKNN